jgi:hypothetical protein
MDNRKVEINKMIKAHMYWMQGWENAPPRARRNYEAWKNAGFDITLWDDNNCDIVWNKYIPAAMRADIVLARAQFNIGGFALGADTSPINVEAMKKSIELLPDGKGQIVLQSKESTRHADALRPYNDASYFPKGNKFIEQINIHNNNVLKKQFTKVPNPCHNTGPDMWKKLLHSHRQYIEFVEAKVAFYREPRVSKFSKDAWLDPGLTGDWYAKKTNVWI